jgi:hypothetical protein
LTLGINAKLVLIESDAIEHVFNCDPLVYTAATLSKPALRRQIPLDLLIVCNTGHTRIVCATSSTRFCLDKLADRLRARRVKTGEIVE